MADEKNRSYIYVPQDSLTEEERHHLINLPGASENNPYVSYVSDIEVRMLLRQIRDRLPAPASEYDYQAVTIQDQAGGLHQYPVRLTEDDRDYTHP